MLLRNPIRFTAFLLASLSAVSYASFDLRGWQEPGLALGIGITASTLGASTSNTRSELLTAKLAWSARGTSHRLVEDTDYFSLDLSFNYEPNSETYDEDRDKLSHEMTITYQRAFWLPEPGRYVSFVVGLEHQRNSQQTEEFESTLYSGLAIDQYTNILGKSVSFGAVGALACNEEEKDDERPRIHLDLGREALNRKGCGLYAQIKLRAVGPKGSIWSLSVDNYNGDYGEKHYRKNRFTASASWVISDSNSCDASIRSIRRNSERDLIAIEDNLYQFHIGCMHHF